MAKKSSCFYFSFVIHGGRWFPFTFFIFRRGGRAFLSRFLSSAVADEYFFHIFCFPPWRKDVSFTFFIFRCGGRTFFFDFTIFRHGGRTFFFYFTVIRRVGRS
ncbi:hypothetical protein [Segatella maculosa]|uniref:hypothetical protein n=1 Tax=Segatella maculosa TaxID=439703 RepID=UPI0024937C22|nr:hypothetical protein [Segatella maculosa]